MKIINQLTNPYSTQWMDYFVSNVITNASLSPKEIFIIDFEINHIFLIVDNVEYRIDIDNLKTIKTENQNNYIQYTQLVKYSLYKFIKNGDEDGTFIKKISYGTETIKWKYYKNTKEKK